MREKIAEVRVNLFFLNILTVLVTVPIMLGFVVAAYSLGAAEPKPLDLFYFLAWSALLVVVHESLHAFAALTFGGLKRDAIKFGINWKALAPYCNCIDHITIRAFRIETLFPLLTTFPLALAPLFFFPSYWLAALAATALCSSIGDVMMFWRLRKFDAAFTIIEHPSGIGGDVFAPDAPPEPLGTAPPPDGTGRPAQE